MHKNSFTKIISLSVLSFFHPEHAKGIDPLSKIVITSKNAICQPESAGKKLFSFTYQDDVKVVFADQSQITSKNLEVLFDSAALKDLNKSKDQQPKKTGNVVRQFKKITFQGNVHIKRVSQVITAHQAELFIPENVCKLKGNVVVKQLKRKPKDIPLEMKSEQALFNLKTEKVTFVGNHTKPVSTTIELDGQVSLQKKGKRKKTRIL